MYSEDAASHGVLRERLASGQVPGAARRRRRGGGRHEQDRPTVGAEGRQRQRLRFPRQKQRFNQPGGD